MGNTNIEWATKVYNPITGCTPCSPGCENCYAARMAPRLAGRFGYPADEPFRPGTFHADKLDEPFRWKKPQRIFVGSMADLFHESIPVEVPTTAKHLDGSIYHVLNPHLASIFGVIAKCQHHRFMILTKRPQRMKAVVDRLMRLEAHLIDTDERSLGNVNFEYGEEFPGLPLQNLWLGVTVCNQAEADAKIPVLLDTPAAGRFVSIEPMLGPIYLSTLEPIGKYPTRHPGCSYILKKYPLDWVICGGETGPNARPLHPDWARSLRDQCQEAGVPFFFKQWGEWIPSIEPNKQQRKNGKVTVLRHDGKIYSNGHAGLWEKAVGVVRVGKAAAGCLLDGKEYKEIPEGLE